MASLLDSYVANVYGGNVRAEPRRLSSALRKSGPIDANTAWGVLQRAKEVYRATPETVVTIMNDRDHLKDVSSKSGYR